MLELLIQKIPSSPLSDEEIAQAVRLLVDEQVETTLKAAFLRALTARGETVEEISGFARELSRLSVKPPLGDHLRSEEILDVVGTGGDRLSTFNISTCVAILCSAAGVCVAKHGNRASTSPIGSADVMEALGLPFDLGPAESAQLLESHRFCFFFAPNYHPAFKFIIPARKLCAQQGSGTVFNLLGPLLNPGRPSAMLVGVARPELCEPMARVLQSLGVRRAMVVSGAAVDDSGATRFLDEISPLGPTTIAEFNQEHALHCSTINPKDFPIQPCSLADLRGGDRETNAKIIRDVLGGRDRGPKRDAVLLNAAAALYVASRTRSLTEGWKLAAQTIDNGQAGEKLQSLADCILPSRNHPAA